MFYEPTITWKPILEFEFEAEHGDEDFLSQQFDVMAYSDTLHEYVTFRCCVWSPRKNDFYTVNGNQSVSATGRPLYWRESGRRGELVPPSGEERTLLLEE